MCGMANRRPRPAITRKLNPLRPPPVAWGERRHRQRTGVPADHFVAQEERADRALRRAVKRVRAELARRERGS